MITSGRRYHPELDGLRAVAALSVVLFHLRGWVLVNGVKEGSTPGGVLDSFLAADGIRMPLFFVLSGFTGALPFAREYLAGAKPKGLRAYYVRRFERIYVPYAIAVIAVFGAGLVFGRIPAAQWPSVIAGLFLSHNVIYGAPSNISVVFWSLEVTMQFYLLAPFLTRLVYRDRSDGRRRLTLLLASLAASWVDSSISPAHPLWNLSLAGHLDEMLAGMLLADVFVSEWRSDPEKRLRWDLLSLGWLAVPWTARTAPLLFGLLVLALYAAALRGAVTSRILGTRALTFVGVMSFSVYLLHFPTLAMFGRWLKPFVGQDDYAGALLKYTATLVPVVLVAARLFFWLVERPCMEAGWSAKLLERWSLAVRGSGRPTEG